MKCDKCKQNNATVYFSKNINGNITEYNLCRDCAEKEGIYESFNREYKLIQNNFFASPFAFFENPFKMFDIFRDTEKNMLSPKESCPYCKSTLEDYKKTGKFGCAMCYETFKDKMKDIKNDESERDKISTLRAKLEKAVKEEHYEDAAKLRDEIKSLESGA